MIKIYPVVLFTWMCIQLSVAELNKGSKYTNRWVANIEGGSEVAQRIARDLGYTYKGQFGAFKNYYELVREDHPDLSLRDSDHVTRSLLDLDEVKWARQQRVFKTVYKDLTHNKKNDDGDKEGNFNSNNQDDGSEDEYEDKQEQEIVNYVKSEAKKLNNNQRSTCQNLFSCIKFPFQLGKLIKRLQQDNLSNLGTFSTRPAPHSQLASYSGATKSVELVSRKISAYEIRFNDPLWRKQWYLQDYRTKDMPVMDHNVVPVYRMGYTGKGVTVAVVDAAIQFDHPDLAQNIAFEKSFDMCQNKPLGEVVGNQKFRIPHGTECAGVIGMVADNHMCGVGIAYNVKIAAINKDCPRDETDEDNAKSIIQNLDQVDVYSFSWGPDDDASTVCALGELTVQAYKTGVTQGRQGKGVIYVQSAGNGGLNGDNCATDCQINQPNVIAITSAHQYGKRSDYSEKCTAIFATTYSGNIYKYNGKHLAKVMSITPGGKCTQDFMGTSASCPVASGIVALTLEARPELTYRDMMHIITRSAEVAPLADNDSWYRNGRGFWVSNEFGFGLLNAENMVILAEKWQTVPKKHTCIVSINLENPEPLSVFKTASVPFETEACIDSPTGKVVYLEHVEVIPVVDYPCRGDIQVNITSPDGTKSLLLDYRRHDVDEDGLEGWPIVSVHNWGESPRGRWILDFQIQSSYPKKKDAEGRVKGVTIKFHGMGERPEHLKSQREYAAFRLPNGLTELGTYD